MNMNKTCAYVTYCGSSDLDRLYGFIALYDSLIATNPKYPIYCAATADVSDEFRTAMRAIGYKVVDMPEISFDGIKSELSNIEKIGYRKLGLFGLTQFDKIVYLGGDTVVLKNIDELFDRPHMTAAGDGACVQYLSEENNTLCADLMVIEPDAALLSDINKYFIEHVDTANWRGPDQSLMHEYFKGAEHKELYLSLDYFVSVVYIENVFNQFGFNKDNIKVLHFSGPKPGMPETYRQFSDWRNSWCYELVNYSEGFIDYVNNCLDRYDVNLPKIDYKKEIIDEE